MSTFQRLTTVIAILALGLGGSYLFRRGEVPLPAPTAAAPIEATATGPAGPASIHGSYLSALPVRAAAAAPTATAAPFQIAAPGDIASTIEMPRPPRAAIDSQPAARSTIASTTWPPQTDSAGRPMVALASEQAAPAVEYHVVRDGDTLAGLAERYLGDAQRQFEIFQENRHVLPSPDVLPIGVKLAIPSRSPRRFTLADDVTASPSARLVPIAPRRRPTAAVRNDR